MLPVLSKRDFQRSFCMAPVFPLVTLFGIQAVKSKLLEETYVFLEQVYKVQI